MCIRDKSPSYLFIITSSNQMYSGTGTAVFDWIKFAKNNFQFSMLIDSQNENNFNITSKFCNDHNVQLYTSAPLNMHGCPDSGVKDIFDHLQQHHYDYIECISWANASTNLSTLSCIPPETKLLYTPHSQPIWTLPDHPKYFMVSPAFKKMLKIADAVFIDSPTERNLPEFTDASSENVHFVPLGVDTAKYSDTGKHIPYQVLCVCDCREPRKRMDLLISTFTKALGLEPKLKLILAGKGSDTLEIQKNISKFVSRLGYIDNKQLLNLYREAALFVLLSDYEAFGLPIAEALCCGTPVLIHQQKELLELFGDLPGVNLVQNTDTNAAAEMIAKLSAVDHSSENIAQSASAKFSFDNTYGKKRDIILKIEPPKRNRANLKQIKILHISPTYYSADSVIGGGEKYIHYMCKALKFAALATDMNVEASVLSFGDKPCKYLLGDGLPCEVIAGKPWDPYSINVQELTDKIDSADVVFVHQCLTSFGLFAASHSKLAKKLVIGTDHGGGEHLLISHTREIGRIFDVLHAQSQFAASSFKNIDGRIEIVAGPVDTAFYKPDQSKPRDSKLVLAIGRILPHKGFDRIIRALPKMLRLVIIGESYDKEYLKHLSQLSRGTSVEFLEQLSDDEVLDLLQTAGLFVHASTHIDYRGTFYQKPELLGLAPLEALSCGMPALVSSAGSLPELAVIHGCLSFADDTALAELLNRYATNSLTFPAAEEIHRDVEEKYGLATFGAKLMTIISRGVELP